MDESKPNSLEAELKSYFGNIDKLIKRDDLPKDVKLSINFFEKAINIFKDNSLKGKLNFSGDLVNYLKNSKNTFEGLSRESNQAVINEASKKSIKFNLKLDGSDYVITGLRIRMDFSGNRQASVNPSLKLFNRIYKFKNYAQGSSHQSLWFDVPFCDAEVLYGSVSAGNMAFEFLTEDPKSCPLRICGMEIFCVSRKDFNFKEKVRRLEKLNAERLSKLAKATAA